MNKLKLSIYLVMHSEKHRSWPKKTFDFFIIFIITVNVLIIMLDTCQNITPKTKHMFLVVENFSIIIFTIEYLLRLWTASYLEPTIPSIKAQLKYVFSFMAIIDLLAIAPLILSVFFPIDLRILQALRSFRILRILKFNRYSDSLKTVGKVLRKASAQLFSSLLVIIVLLIISSVLMYSAEHRVQPEVFRNAFSGLWWAIVTVTTVGYGDIYPVTALGRFLSTIVSLLGIGLVAVPTGIISAGFVTQKKRNSQKNLGTKEKKYCPYCGEKL